MDCLLLEYGVNIEIFLYLCRDVMQSSNVLNFISNMQQTRNASLRLENGAVFRGKSFGY